MSGKRFQDLVAWQKAMDLVELVYRESADFPLSEQYGLVSQIRRAVVSVPSNLAEGQGRESNKEFLHFLAIAMGSLREVETQLLIAVRLNFIEPSKMTDFEELIAEIGKTINGLRKHLRSKLPTNH